MDTARGRIVALTEAQRQFTAAAQIIQSGNDSQKEAHLARLERLRQLAEQEKLTAAEQQEAQTIVNALNGAYNDLGLGIDTITGKLNLAASAQDKFNEAMKAATLGELDAEIAEHSKAHLRFFLLKEASRRWKYQGRSMPVISPQQFIAECTQNRPCDNKNASSD